MGLPVGSWICRNAIFSVVLVAVNSSTGMETSESRIWPFQMGLAAGIGGPGNAETEQRITEAAERPFHSAGKTLRASPLLPLSSCHGLTGLDRGIHSVSGSDYC